ncbi:MAG: metallo-beta-lactamase family protein [Treponematales bacterium]
MKVFVHYCTYGFSNCYILGSDYEESPNAPRDAVIIDPGCMDESILKVIEGSEYKLRGVLLTHDHKSHIHGLTTLMRIYHPEVYAINAAVKDYKTRNLRDSDSVAIGPFTIEVISVPGHSADSAVFKIERCLFTGDALSAGLTGSTASSYGAAVQINALRSKVLSLPGDYTLFPGHGPPSSLEAERRFNEGIHSYNAQNTARPTFKADVEYLS